MNTRHRYRGNGQWVPMTAAQRRATFAARNQAARVLAGILGKSFAQVRA